MNRWIVDSCKARIKSNKQLAKEEIKYIKHLPTEDRWVMDAWSHDGIDGDMV
jgi:hypothetical protein